MSDEAQSSHGFCISRISKISSSLSPWLHPSAVHFPHYIFQSLSSESSSICTSHICTSSLSHLFSISFLLAGNPLGTSFNPPTWSTCSTLKSRFTKYCKISSQKDNIQARPDVFKQKEQESSVLQEKREIEKNETIYDRTSFMTTFSTDAYLEVHFISELFS